MKDDPGARRRTLTSLLVSMALWPLGLVGMFFLFFGDGSHPTHDPRDAALPYFFSAMLVGTLLVLGLAVPVWRRHPVMCIAATIMAAPWLLFSGVVLIRVLTR